MSTTEEEAGQPGGVQEEEQRGDQQVGEKQGGEQQGGEEQGGSSETEWSETADQPHQGEEGQDIV